MESTGVQWLQMRKAGVGQHHVPEFKLFGQQIFK